MSTSGHDGCVVSEEELLLLHLQLRQLPLKEAGDELLPPPRPGGREAVPAAVQERGGAAYISGTRDSHSDTPPPPDPP
eukprot:CAMPEP_0197576212 /NCGR_PEP_ID=MMETSP1326-20131121/1317_1 /TAXON_ID=1155430 /ORGANISM="Genus nov. species nov., Strain RCC2288" /LENGTH=77 /DNA_ID=CAMNT_0043139087 /DNA_START=166 /DNA_END=396 /DNA_ORIENTATION=+